MEREYSVNFGQYNTWSDWHLTPAERPIVVPPTEKTHNIDLPGGSGVIDAAQALTGYPVFNRLSICFMGFIIVEDLESVKYIKM